MWCIVNRCNRIWCNRIFKLEIDCDKYDYILHPLLLESSSIWIFFTSIVIKSSSKAISNTSNITINASFEISRTSESIFCTSTLKLLTEQKWNTISWSEIIVSKPISLYAIWYVHVGKQIFYRISIAQKTLQKLCQKYHFDAIFRKQTHVLTSLHPEDAYFLQRERYVVFKIIRCLPPAWRGRLSAHVTVFMSSGISVWKFPRVANQHQKKFKTASIDCQFSPLWVSNGRVPIEWARCFPKVDLHIARGKYEFKPPHEWSEQRCGLCLHA